MKIVRIVLALSVVLLFVRCSTDVGTDWRRPNPGIFDGKGGGAGGESCGTSTQDVAPLEDVQSEALPLPVTGSTLFVSKTTGFAAAADPDGNTLSLIHLGQGDVARNPALDVQVSFAAGDWPYKPAEDNSGAFHLLLRGVGQLASVTRQSPTSIRRIPLCAQPRGLAYDAALNLLYAACAEGSVLVLNPESGQVIRRLETFNDLRDILIVNGRVMVTRFRTAELVELDLDESATTPVRQVTRPLVRELTPAVAWKTVAAGSSALMLHQSEQLDEVQVSCSGYGGTSSGGFAGGPGGSSGSGIVRSAITVFLDDTSSPMNAQLTQVACLGGALPVDAAVSADSQFVAFIEAGSYRLNAMNFTSALSSAGRGCMATSSLVLDRSDRPLAVAFTSDNRIVVQTSKPRLLVLPTTLGPSPAELWLHADIALPGKPVKQTGHRLFHDATGANVACASCHPEGQDDGQVWRFSGIGPRRTQTLGGGISGTQPFHWDGDMHTFSLLLTEVMQTRMSGPMLENAKQAALLRWMDSIPAVKVPAKDATAAARGKALFESAETACSGCHSGAQFTNNLSAMVGTGGAFQVPTLIGLGARGPFMHDGCANTLEERFGPCGGGDSHGRTSQLSAEQTSDLVSYLKTL